MSKQKRVLIIDDVHEILPNGLREAGFEVVYEPAWGRSELIEAIGDCEGLVVRTKTTIDKNVLSRAINLKWIARAGAGLDNIDTQYCDEKNIQYFNAGEANADAVGEQTIAMLLSLMANVVKADKEVRNVIWDREGNRGEELSGKTVGIIGYGNTGKAVARKLSGFNVRVLAYDKYLKNYADAYAIEATMENIFAEADVLTLHVPLTDETFHLVDNTYINEFRKRFYLLNLSRGKVANLNDVCRALKEGKIKKAALDVLENESLKMMNEAEKVWFEDLKSSANVILTPHIGGWTKESYKKISHVLLQKIKELRIM